MLESKEISRGIHKGLGIGLATLCFIAVVVLVLYQQRTYKELFMETMNNIQWLQLGIGWLIMVSVIYILGYRLKALLPVLINIWIVLGPCLAAGLLLNHAIPGPFGELVSSYFIHKKSDV